MGTTGITQLDDSVHTKYQSDYLVAAAQKDVWGQFVDWEDPIQEGNGGSTFTYLGYEEMNDDDVNAKLPEAEDIEPTPLTDSSVTVTPYEYGRRVRLTRLVRFQSQTKVREIAAGIVGRNQANTVQKAIRRGVLGGSYVLYPTGCTARTDLDTTSDLLGWSFLTQLAALAHSMGIEPWDSEGNFALVIHPAMMKDILGITEVKDTGKYQESKIMFRGECANFAGFRFIKSLYGKLYLGGGTAAQAATALTSATAAGATSVTVDTATGIAAGDILTIGTLESATVEQCVIVSGSNPYVVRGVGNGRGNTGLRWAHDAGEAVNEAANVAGLVVVGKNSIKGVYGADTGRFGKSVVKVGTDSLERFVSQGWLWYGGIGIVSNYVLRGEVACSQYIYGSN